MDIDAPEFRQVLRYVDDPVVLRAEIDGNAVFEIRFRLFRRDRLIVNRNTQFLRAPDDLVFGKIVLYLYS